MSKVDVVIDPRANPEPRPWSAAPSISVGIESAAAKARKDTPTSVAAGTGRRLPAQFVGEETGGKIMTTLNTPTMPKRLPTCVAE